MHQLLTCDQCFVGSMIVSSKILGSPPSIPDGILSYQKRGESEFDRDMVHSSVKSAFCTFLWVFGTFSQNKREILE